MREKKIKYAIYISITIALLISSYLFLRKSTEKFNFTSILPKQTAVYVYIDTSKAKDTYKREGWHLVWQHPYIRKIFKKGDIRVNLLKKILYSIDTKAALAYIEDNKNSLCILLQVKHPTLVKKSLKPYKIEKYEGFSIYIVGSNKHPLAMSFIGRVMVISDLEENIKKCIDVALKKSKNLQENPQFNIAMKKLPPNSFVKVYMDMKKNICKHAIYNKSNTLKYLCVGVKDEKNKILLSGFLGLDEKSTKNIMQKINSHPTTGIVKSANFFPKDATFYCAFNFKALNTFITLPQMPLTLHRLTFNLRKSLTGEVAIYWDLRGFISQKPILHDESNTPMVAVFFVSNKKQMKHTLKNIHTKFKSLIFESYYKKTKLYCVKDTIFTLYNDTLLVGSGSIRFYIMDIMEGKVKNPLSSSKTFQSIKNNLGERTLWLSKTDISHLAPLLIANINVPTNPIKKYERSLLKRLKHYGNLWCYANINQSEIELHMILEKNKTTAVGEGNFFEKKLSSCNSLPKNLFYAGEPLLKKSVPPAKTF